MERLKFMVSLFVKVTTGILFVTAIYIPVFYGWEIELDVKILWQILILSAVCTAGSILLPIEGEREVSRKFMLVSSILYYMYINVVVLLCGFWFEWFSIQNMKQVLGMLAAIAFVYFVTFALSYWLESLEAEKMNQKLRERE